MKQAFVKSWATTAIGVVLLLYIGYKLYLEPDLDIATVFNMLIALGFIASKDATASHTKEGSGSKDKNPTE